jgi:hypothetical protein
MRRKKDDGRKELERCLSEISKEKVKQARKEKEK